MREDVQLMLPVTRLGEVVRSLPAAAFLGVAGMSWVNHELCCDQTLVGAGGRGVAQSALQPAEGHVLAHRAQAQVHVWPPGNKHKAQVSQGHTPSSQL